MVRIRSFLLFIALIPMQASAASWTITGVANAAGDSFSLDGSVSIANGGGSANYSNGVISVSVVTTSNSMTLSASGYVTEGGDICTGTAVGSSTITKTPTSWSASSSINGDASCAYDDDTSDSFPVSGNFLAVAQVNGPDDGVPNNDSEGSADPNSLNFDALSGAVQILRPDSDDPNTLTQIPITDGSVELRPGDSIETGPDGAATFATGGGNIIEMFASTKLAIGDIANSLGTNIGQFINMTTGKVRAVIEQQYNRRFQVRTPMASTAVRGTEFTVEYVDNGDGTATQTVVVMEGTVEVINSAGEILATVSANETFTFSATPETGFVEASTLSTGIVYLMTASSSINVTSSHIINSSATEQEFTGTLYNRDGDQLGSADQPLSSGAIPPSGRLTLTSPEIESIFGIDPWAGPAMLEVTGSDAFELMSKLISPSGLVSNTNCVREDRVLNIEGFDSDNMTFVRFINTTDASMSAITGTLYDSNGDVIGNDEALMLDSLAPKEAVWINRNGFATKMGMQWTGEALLEIGSVEGLQLLNLNLVNGETFFNFSCFESSNSGSVYLQTTSTSQNISLTHLVNTANVAQQFSGTLYNRDGEQLGSANQPLHTGLVAAKGRVILSSEQIEQTFAISPWSGPAIVEVSGSDTFELMTKLTSPSGLISNTNCVRSDQVHNIEGFDSTDMTYIRFINTGAAELTNLGGSLYDSNGDLIGTADQILVETLPAKSAVWLNRDNLSVIFSDTWNNEASLRVESSPDALRLLNLNLINNETFFNFSCYESGS